MYDGILLPYKLNGRNKHVIPAKIYECFGMGMPIFSTHMLWTSEFNGLLNISMKQVALSIKFQILILSTTCKSQATSDCFSKRK